MTTPHFEDDPSDGQIKMNWTLLLSRQPGTFIFHKGFQVSVHGTVLILGLICWTTLTSG